MNVADSWIENPFVGAAAFVESSGTTNLTRYIFSKSFLVSGFLTINELFVLTETDPWFVTIAARNVFAAPTFTYQPLVVSYCIG